MVSMHEEDPDEADSDHEYEPLEVDRADESRIRAEAGAFDDVDPLDVEEGGDGPEQMFPSRDETRVQEDELQGMLEESVNRDPEALAMDMARRHDPDARKDFTPEAWQRLDRSTELRPDDLDTEDLSDRI